jgi:hypothetical protein
MGMYFADTGSASGPEIRPGRPISGPESLVRNIEQCGRAKSWSTSVRAEGPDTLRLAFGPCACDDVLGPGRGSVVSSSEIDGFGTDSGPDPEG